MAKPLHLVSNIPTEVPAVAVSAGAGDAGKLPELDASGRLDLSMMPTGLGPDVKVIEASENLDAGDFVNIHDSTGEKVRKADASTANAGRIAHGFVLNNVTSGNNATVYFEGENDQLTGLTPGTTYVLSADSPGEIVPLASGTTDAGESLQIVGVATSATSLNAEIGKPTIRG